jgi:hypothetical protein
MIQSISPKTQHNITLSQIFLHIIIDLNKSILELSGCIEEDNERKNTEKRFSAQEEQSESVDNNVYPQPDNMKDIS